MVERDDVTDGQENASRREEQGARRTPGHQHNHPEGQRHQT